MSLRSRFTVGAALAVVAVVLLAAVGVYGATARQLRDQVDRDLEAQVASLRDLADGRGGTERPLLSRVPRPRLGGPGAAQVVTARGRVLPVPGTEPLPVTDAAVEAAADGGRGFETVQVDGRSVRILSVAWSPGVALQVARALDEVDDALVRLRRVLVVVVGVAAVAAVGLGLVVSRAALVPVRRLTEAAERVAATRDLSVRIDPDGADEVARLGAAFDEMLDALDRSVQAQRGLVADASHELRTPLTSARTNVEVLRRWGDLDPAERAQILERLDAQIAGLADLVGDVIELARGDAPVGPVEDVRLDELVADAVGAARIHHPAIDFRVSLAPCIVRGDAPRLGRAVANLLANAAAWSPPGGPVEVGVRDGAVDVRDHGPGIAPEDLPYVFDRFWRAPAARARPGSGLGLAIVAQVAQAHGGSVAVEHPAGGGARLRFALPTEPGVAAPSR